MTLAARYNGHRSSYNLSLQSLNNALNSHAFSSTQIKKGFDEGIRGEKYAHKATTTTF